MVKLYYNNSSGITPKDVDKLPLWRREKALRYKREPDRNNCAAAYFLLELAFREFGLNFRDYLWRYNERGKPFTDAPLKFNLSHTDSLVVCAVSDKEVGVDIQKIEPYDPNLVRHVMSNAELARIENADNDAYEFCRLWTEKEAIAKYWGIGMCDAKNITLPEDCKTVTIKLDDYLITCCCQK